MLELSNWQWALAAAALLVCLVLGGWLSRESWIEDEPASSVSEAPSTDPGELSQLQQQLEARDSELKAAREESELTLLQLHQVQEELEHYFLQSRDLQQKLDAALSITPKQQAQLKRIKARLLELVKTLPASANRNAQAPSGDRLEVLVQRQQNALRRFQALQKAS